MNLTAEQQMEVDAYQMQRDAEVAAWIAYLDTVSVEELEKQAAAEEAAG
jgi:hypothetical protein